MLSITSPATTKSPGLAWPLSLAGWLVDPAVAGAAVGYMITPGSTGAQSGAVTVPTSAPPGRGQQRGEIPGALSVRKGERPGGDLGRALLRRDLPERQQTLRNTLDWSFGLLPASERELFARLGVFAGSFGLPAAEAIGAGSPDQGHAGRPGQVMDTLGALVDSSLVRPDTRGGEPRFSLLETIREYALDRLREGGDWAQAHDRHAAYFQAMAEPAAPDLAGPGQLAWLDRLETEHDNLWAAVSWLVDHGPLEQAVQLILVTWRFWWLHGHAAELARPGDDFVAGSQDLPPSQHALALTQAGFIIVANGDPARARQLFEQALPLYRQDSAKLAVSVWNTHSSSHDPPRPRWPTALLRRDAEHFGMGPAVVLGQDLTEAARPVRHGAVADLATGDRQLGNGHREAAEGDLLICLYDASPAGVILP